MASLGIHPPQNPKHFPLGENEIEVILNREPQMRGPLRYKYFFRPSYPHTPPDAHTNTQPSWFMVLTGGSEARRKAVGGVSALTRTQWRPPRRSHNVPRCQRHTGSGAQGGGGGVRDLITKQTNANQR